MDWQLLTQQKDYDTLNKSQKGDGALHYKLRYSIKIEHLAALSCLEYEPPYLQIHPFRSSSSPSQQCSSRQISPQGKNFRTIFKPRNIPCILPKLPLPSCLERSSSLCFITLSGNPLNGYNNCIILISSRKVFL
jgi:hypothetical protein